MNILALLTLLIIFSPAPAWGTATIAPQPAQQPVAQPEPAPVPAPVQVEPAPSGGINIWVVVGLLGTVLWTNVAMIILKRQFPDWQHKAWAPPTIGIVTALLGALSTGQINSWPDLLVWLAAGSGAGALASSARDVKVGK